MNTSQDFTLCEPTGTDKIDVATLGYMRARNRHRLYDLVVGEFERSELTQADLARRLGKKPEIVCRLLAAPGNWQLDTVSDLLFAISGAEASYEIAHPLSAPPLNSNYPDWLADTHVPNAIDATRTSDTGSTTVVVSRTVTNVG